MFIDVQLRLRSSSLGSLGFSGDRIIGEFGVKDDLQCTLNVLVFFPAQVRIRDKERGHYESY